MKKTSTFQNGLIWFGAGVSLAEILTGTSFAPLGMAKGFAAILIGHIIGCAMMLLAGLIGGRTGRSAMETVKMSFGQKGGLLFAFLNVLQLVGWTAIMIYDGALAVGGIFAIGRWVWCLVIGALIVLWIAVGITDLGWINKITMAALFILTLVLCKGHLLLRQRHGRRRRREPDLRRGGGAGRGDAAVLAAAYQRLHPRRRKAHPGHLGQRAGLRRGVLLDVRHRHGCGDFHRRV